ncbi:MAG: glycosyltransferase family 4 protein [Bacteroidales bacterium]|nr:glycosyltransferase family 4 protein [Bacteroidales bacterium]MCL2132857.1 glycosyltransferase family 4 protein [Bacteroidales bacterium]
MNVLHIMAQAEWGGGEQYVYDLAQRQITCGHKVAVLSAPSTGIEEKVSQLACSHFVIKHRSRFNPCSIYHFRKIISQHKIDVVHVNQFQDAFIAVFAALSIPAAKRPRVVMTRHLVRKGKANFLYCWLYRKIHKLIFVSKLAKEKFSTHISLPDIKTPIIHNSIAPSLAAGGDIDYRKQLGLDEQCMLIGYVGRLVDFKGVELLIEVAEKFIEKNVAFLLAGSGDKDYEHHLHTLIKEKQLDSKLFLMGFLNNPANFMEKMTIAVLPSLCVESFGLSILQFMRAGVPTITSNTGAQSEFVKNGETGILVNPTVAEVEQALVELLNDEQKRQHIGANAKHYCEEFLSYDIFFKKTMEAYD